MALSVLGLVTGSVVTLVGFSIPATYVTRYVAWLTVSLARHLREGSARGKRLADVDWSMRHSAIEFLRQSQDYGGPGRGLVACLKAKSGSESPLKRLEEHLASSKILAGRIDSSTLGKLSLDKEAKKMANFAAARDVIRRLDTALIIYSFGFFLSLMGGKDSCEAGDITSAVKYAEMASRSLTKLDGVLASRKAFVLNPDIPYSTFLSSLDEIFQNDLGIVASLEEVVSSAEEMRKPTVYDRPVGFLTFVFGKGTYWARLADMAKEAASSLGREFDMLDFERFVEKFRDRYPGVEASEGDLIRVLRNMKKTMGDIDMKVLPDFGRVVVCRSLGPDAVLVVDRVRREGSVTAEDISKTFGWSGIKSAYLLAMLVEEHRLSMEVLDGQARYRLRSKTMRESNT